MDNTANVLSDDQGSDSSVQEIPVSPTKRRKRYSQTQLSSSAFTDGMDSQCHVGVGSPEHPKWVRELLQFYKVESKQAVKNLPKSWKYTMKCQLCVAVNKSTPVTDKCAYAFKRHLKGNHLAEYNKLEQLKGPGVESTSSASVLQSPPGKPQIVAEKYGRQDPRQLSFERDVVNFVVHDTFPFNVTEGVGFQRLILNRDIKLRIPSPRTVERRVKRQYEAKIEEIRRQVQGQPVLSCHLVMDIWSSEQGSSIMGFLVHFIHEWKMKQILLGFREFPVSHSGKNIRDLMEGLLATEFQLSPQQIGSVTSDNASNMIAAFKISGAYDTSESYSQVLTTSDDITDSGSVTGEVSLTDEEVAEANLENAEHHASTELVDLDDDAVSPMLVTGIETWKNATVNRNHCLAHLLQLAIKDAISESRIVSDVAKKLHKLVSFFQKSSHWKTSLKQRTGNMVLVRPCATRWNALYYALERLMMSTEKVNMIQCVNDTLNQARDEAGRRMTIPDRIFTDDTDDIAALKLILEPLALFTNELQSNSVTSSGVILGLFTALRGVNETTFDNEHMPHVEVIEFQQILTRNLKHRFASVVPEETILERRNIVTIDVCSNRNFVLAALLDSRIKTLAFEATAAIGTGLEGKLPSKEDALGILRTECERLHQNNLLKELGSEGQTTSDLTIEGQSDSSPPPPSKKPRGMLVLLSELQNAASTSSTARGNDTTVNSEIEDYMKMKIEPSQSCPLSFWRKNEKRLPVLALAARIYLGFPASSGSIERVFSVAKSLGKARNARLNPETVERLLCCKYSNGGN